MRNPAVEKLKIDSAMPFSQATYANPAWKLNDRPKFNFVIIHEDIATGNIAHYFYNHFIHELGEECDFSFELWNFQVLAISAIGNSALQVATQADFVIFSLHGRAGIPAETRRWIKAWSRLVADSDAALIVLTTDKPQSRGGKTASTLAYLRRIAQRIKIAFISHPAFSPTSELVEETTGRIDPMMLPIDMNRRPTIFLR